MAQRTQAGATVDRAGGRLPRLTRAISAGRDPQNHPQSIGWRLLRLLIASSKDHAFLDRPWIGRLLQRLPKKMRGPVALRLLSLSPHYLVYQHTNYYPKGMRRAEVLQRELARNQASRRQICDKLLLPYLDKGQTVLDFGCGPGWLAREVSRHVAKLIATDVSRGVLACARELSPAENVTYVPNGLDNLAAVATGSIHLAYSFAVFQHLRPEQTAAFLREFARVIRPGGRGLFHTVLREPNDSQPVHEHTGWVSQRVNVRMVFLSEAEIRGLLTTAGCKDIQVRLVSTVADLNDDIGSEYLVTFTR